MTQAQSFKGAMDGAVQPAGSARVARFRTAAVRVGGHSLMCDLWGESNGAPVVLLHGIPGWRGIWRPVAALLAARAHVVAPDLAGFGESSAAPPEFHAAEHADLVIGLIRSLNLGPVHLAGFDFGGPVAVLVCGRAPELAASVTLAATNVLPDTPIPLGLQLVRPRLVGDAFARLMFGVAGLSAMWFAAVKRRERYPLAEYRAMLRFDQGVVSTRRVFQASLRNLPGLYGPVFAALKDIRVPCSVVWGDHDPFFPIAVGRQTASSVRGARFVRLEGCGHVLPAEDPEGFAAVIESAVFGEAAARETRSDPGRSGRTRP